MDHLQRARVDSALVGRWIAVGRMLPPGNPLAIELADLERDPTRHMLGRALNAARYLAGQATGEKRIAIEAVIREMQAATE